MTSTTAASSEASISTIVFVDDEVLVRMTICQYLRECGYKVIEAASADEALEILKSEVPIDIVLSAFAVRGSMNGFELAKWIRNNKNSLEIILVGSPEKAANTAADLCENGPMLSKPYEPQALLEAIRRNLGLWKPAAHDQSVQPSL
jgi:CheY-like chemotaxis protein